MEQAEKFFAAPLMLLFALYALANAHTASAFIYNLSYECEEGCLEKTPVVWNITFYKGFGDSVRLSRVEIIGSGTGASLGFYNDSPVRVYKKENFKIEGKLPAFPKDTNSTSLNVSPCFTTMLELSDTIIEDGFIGMDRTYCEKFNHSVELYQCLEQKQCSEAETCVNSTCKPVTCGSCQYVSNHACANYECCEHGQCEPQEECRENRCSPLDCQPGYEARDNTCSEIVCLESEELLNSTCKPLNCLGTEKTVNHTCVALNCGIYEAANDHSCKKIELSVELKEVQDNLLKALNAKKKQSKSTQTAEVAGARLPPLASWLLETALLSAILALVILFAKTIHKNK